MTRTTSHQNNLLLLLPHLGGALMGDVEEQVARSSYCSSDPPRLVFDGWHTTLSQMASGSSRHGEDSPADVPQSLDLVAYEV